MGLLMHVCYIFGMQMDQGICLAFWSGKPHGNRLSVFEDETEPEISSFMDTKEIVDKAVALIKHASDIPKEQTLAVFTLRKYWIP
jgi:hypothetical protein